ncbi:MAG: hypothetical protein HQL98_16195 [Magnetococcales bacterium]|nr:hypothetical protein [Magnetococcales bacterium]
MYSFNVLDFLRMPYRRPKRVDRVTVRNWPPRQGLIAIQPDDRDDGLNPGGVVLTPGHPVHVLVHVGPGVSSVRLSASAGELWPDPPQVYSEEVDLVFSETDTATLSHPVQSIDSWTWMGAALGSLSLAADGLTVRAESSGLAVARLRVTIQAYGWRIMPPEELAGARRFPIALVASGMDGDVSGTGEIVVQRGDGRFPGADVVEPLAATVDVMRERGRAEMDAGEPLQSVTLDCLFLPGILPGQLVEVRDDWLGVWRGQVMSVRHEISDLHMNTTIDLLRRVDDRA